MNFIQSSACLLIYLQYSIAALKCQVKIKNFYMHYLHLSSLIFCIYYSIIMVSGSAYHVQ
nr:MAG TPA: hypothetical protein [Caudoviricetes sp.]